MALHWPFGHLSPKLWAKERQKSGIDLFPTFELKVKYVVEKMTTRATSLV
jgi:hypothetical protein